MQSLVETLPNPDAIASAHSERLTRLIKDRIREDGPLSFRDFMQMALYEPGLGYYVAGSTKFGPQGDFVTAPEISSLFGQSLAILCQQVISSVSNPCLIEFGAGSGRLAYDILKTLNANNTLPQHYYIIEVSPQLRQVQQQLLATLTLPKDCVIWLDALPTKPVNGMIIANEVLDAMPVHRLLFNANNISEYFVNLVDEQFTWLTQPLQDRDLLSSVRQTIPYEFDDYVTEFNPWYQAWCQSLYDCLDQGIALIIDYGFPQHEFYHAERATGTMMCHYRHYAHTDPFLYPGLQDITTHVDFSALAHAATACRWQVQGYTQQANFLIDLGIDQLMMKANPEQQLAYSQQCQRLLMPHEMGELFKVIALSKHFQQPLLGFRRYNQLQRLKMTID